MARFSEVGEAPDCVEKSRRAIGRDIADERDKPMIGPIHRSYLLDRRPHGPTGANRDDGRLVVAQNRFKQVRGALGDAGHCDRGGWVGRCNLTDAKVVFVRQPRGELHAACDGVFKAEGDQLLR